MLSIGCLALSKNLRGINNISFFLTTLSLSIWLLGTSVLYSSKYEQIAVFWIRLHWSGVVFIGSSIYFFTVSILNLLPKKKGSVKWGYLFSFLFLGSLWTGNSLISGANHYFWGYYAKTGFLVFPFLVIFFTQMLFCFYHYYQSYKKIKSTQLRRQVKIVFASFIIAYTASADYLPAMGVGIYPFGYLPMILFVSTLFYSIVKYRLMDISTVIHKTAMWAALSSLILVPILGLVYFKYDWIIHLSRTHLLITVAFLALAYIPYIKVIQPRIDHLFQRRKYDMQKILQGMVRELALLKDLKGLTEKIVTTIREALYVSDSSIILWEEKKRQYSIIGDQAFSIDLSKHHAFLDWMRKEDRVIEWNEVATDPRYEEIKTPAYLYFEALAAKVALPLVHDHNLIGVINLGEKDNLKLFTSSDIEFLSNLRAEATIALSNSLLYDDVQKMSEQLRRWALELEEKVAERTHQLSERTKELSESKTELERSYLKLQELDYLKSQFFANISHEFRTPLTLILAPLESFLNRTDIPEDQRKHFHIMHQNGLRLLKLINNLLDLAKIDTGKMEISYSKTDLVAFMKGVVASLTFLAEKKQIHLSFTAERGPIVFYFDCDKIEKVLLNLIFNAIKFTEPGGRIDLSCEEREGHVLVKVSDTGIGIAAENLHKLFNRFTQIDASASRRHEGTGIGLALCKELIDLHRGKIWAESEVGRGTVLSFTLPYLTELPISERSVDTIPQNELEEDWIRSLHKAAEYAEGGILQEPPALAQQTATGEQSRPKILVVEDNPDMLHFIASQLQGEYQIIPARNGVEGIERAKADLPDLILADVMMPIKDGYQLCREVKEDLRTRHTPVVLVTAKADLSMKIEGLEQGADDYLTKPFSSEELRARVKSLLNLRTLEKEIQIRNQALERTLSELQQTQTQLIHSAKMAALGTLVAGLSHELNNPLTAVTGFAEILLSMPLPKEAHQHTENIFREGRRCAAIVRSLSDFARKAPPLRQENDLNVLVHSVLELKASYLRTDNIILKLDLDPHLPKTLVDGNQIKQVLLNLLNNAHQAVLMNEKDRRIRIVSEQAGGFLRLTIGDNGPGIPKEVQPRIFEPFFTTKPEGEGTGLGLSISYGIIESHGGKIGFISEEGMGTRFWFELPIRTSASTASNVLSDTGARYQDKRALVVDDEPMVLEVCKTALEQVGFYVDAVQSGEAALEQLTKASYDLLVSDVRMPGMGGIQFLEQVSCVYPEVLDRTILITGDAVNPVTSKFLKRPGITVLEKPFDLKKLQHLARLILNRISTPQWRNR
jgi:signal transduction histidine kinase